MKLIISMFCFISFSTLSYKLHSYDKESLSQWASQIDMELIEKDSNGHIPNINEFKFKTLEGDDVSFDQWQDKIVFLNIWATWCSPCRIEMPALNKLNSAFKDTKFSIIAVSIDSSNDRETVQEFINDKELDLPIFLDDAAQIAKTFNLEALPSTFLIDTNGDFLGIIYGYREWHSSTIQNFIDYLLDPRAYKSYKNYQSFLLLFLVMLSSVFLFTWWKKK